MGDDGWNSGGEADTPVGRHSSSTTYYNQSRNRDQKPRWNDRNEGGYDRERQDRGGRGFGGRGGGGRGGRGRERSDYGRSDDGESSSNWRSGNSGGGGGGRRYDSNSSTTIEINSSDVGRIIGRGGSRIKELQEESGAYIKIGKNEGYNSATTTVTIIGSPESQDKAKQLIDDVTSQARNGYSASNDN